MKLAKIKIVLSITLLSAGLLIFFYIKNRVPFAEQKPAVNDTAPAISLADLSGKMVSLSDFEGRVILVNFWASWCPPCKAEMPIFQKAFDIYGDKGFAVIGIAVDDVTPALVRDMGIAYPVVKTNKRVTKDYGEVADVPVSFLIGRDGRIIKKVRKVYPESALRSDIEDALGIGK